MKILSLTWLGLKTTSTQIPILAETALLVKSRLFPRKENSHVPDILKLRMRKRRTSAKALLSQSIKFWGEINKLRWIGICYSSLHISVYALWYLLCLISYILNVLISQISNSVECQNGAHPCWLFHLILCWRLQHQH